MPLQHSLVECLWSRSSKPCYSDLPERLQHRKKNKAAAQIFFCADLIRSALEKKKTKCGWGSQRLKICALVQVDTLGEDFYRFNRGFSHVEQSGVAVVIHNARLCAKVSKTTWRERGFSFESAILVATLDRAIERASAWLHWNGSWRRQITYKMKHC